MEFLRQFEEAMKTLESACCLNAEFTDLGDPYDDHEQSHRRDLQQTYHSKFSKKVAYIVTTPCFCNPRICLIKVFLYLNRKGKN